MSQEPTAQPALPVSATMAQLRRRKAEATQALLGDTIAISDEAWQEPSRLPGWTRAHVATHLARNADGLRRVAEGFLAGTPTRMYGSEAERRSELESGSRRGALDLQIDLDTTAGQLNRALTAVEDSGLGGDVELSAGFWFGVHTLPVIRLSEVVLHHIDLQCGFTAADVDADIAGWLLEWTVQLVADRIDFPALALSSSSGLEARLGRADDEPTMVHGSDAELLGWLTGRGDAQAIAGAAGLVLPEL